MMAKTISAPEIIAKAIIAPFLMIAMAIPGGFLIAKGVYTAILILTKIVIWASKKIINCLFDYLEKNDPGFKTTKIT